MVVGMRRMRTISKHCIESIWDRVTQSGTHTAVWNASSRSSGVYFIRMDSPGGSFVKKVMLIK